MPKAASSHQPCHSEVESGNQSYASGRYYKCYVKRKFVVSTHTNSHVKKYATARETIEKYAIHSDKTKFCHAAFTPTQKYR
jgi:hypothetical protein